MPRFKDISKFIFPLTEEDISQCFTCKRDHMDGTCDAFPEGIPFDILTNEFDHTLAHKDDMGLQYERLSNDQ